MGTESFHMTIGVSPTRTNLEKELDFIKVALLYSDRVRLCSPTSSIFLELLQITLVENDYDKARFLNAMLKPIGFEDMANVLYLFKKKGLSRNELLMRERLRVLIRKTWGKTKGMIETLLDNSGISGLETAYNTGKLEIDQYEADDTDEFLDSIMENYLVNINNSVISGKSYPILDENTSKLINLYHKKNNYKNEQVNMRIKHGGLTLDIINRLPCFEKASIDEILDIRKELQTPLIRFRSLMLGYSKEIQSNNWDDEFNLEVEDLFRREFEPILLEIDELISENKYLKRLSGDIINSKWKVPTATLGAGFSLLTDYLNVSHTVMAAGATLGHSALTSYQEWKEEKRNIKRNQLYFYYRTSKELSKVK